MRDEFDKLARKHGKGKKGLITIKKEGVLKDIPRSAEAIMRMLKRKRTKMSDSSGDATTPLEEYVRTPSHFIK